MRVSGATVEEIVGRDEDLSLLASFLANDDQILALTIEGDAGIGKTTLWRAGLEMAEARSYVILSSRPSSSDVRLSYAGLGDLLAHVGAEILDELPPPQRQALRVALLLEDPGERPPDSRSIGVAFLGVVSSIARETRVLIAIDDVQWLDQPSEEVLRFVARRLDGHMAKLLLAERREEDAPYSEVLEALSPDEVRRIFVGPLSLGALHRVIRSRAGYAMRRPLLVRVHETSGGNPFHALEIAEALARDEAFRDSDQLPLPRSARDLITARVGALPRSTRSFLEIVALLSDPTLATVEAALPDNARLDVALDRAEGAGLVECRGERIGFAHPLLAAAVAGEIEPSRRRRLHLRIAGVVADPEERARHLALGTTRPSEDVAAELEDAARRAAARGAATVAAELADLAVRATPSRSRAHAQRRLRRAGYRTAAGDIATSRDDLAGLIDELPRGNQRAEALLHLGRARQDFDEMESLALQALNEATKDALRVRILDQLAEAAAIHCDTTTALAYARAGVEAAEATGDDRLLAVSAALQGLLETFDGHLSSGLLERAVALERRVGYLSMYESPTVVLGYRLVYRGTRFDEARELLTRADETARAHGDDSARTALLLHLSELEIAAGRWRRALELANEGRTLAEQFSAPYAESALLYAAALACACIGDAEEARSLAERGQDLAKAAKGTIHEVNNLHALGFLDLSLGDVQAAASRLSPLPDRLIALGYGHGGVVRRLPDAIEALIMAGDLVEARRKLELLDRFSREVEMPVGRAAATRCLGLLQAAEGDGLRAVGTLEQAVEQYNELPIPLERGRTLLALGEAQRRGKQKRPARESLGAALAIFEELGARIWAGRAKAELGRISGRRAASDELTATQRRVAALVAEGHTNREVAASLFVSERTIEGHLTSIYGKLGVRSRAELVRQLTHSRR